MSENRRQFYLLVLTVFIAIPFFVLPASVLAFNIGEDLSFSTSDKFDFSGRKNISATLRLVGQKAQYFFEDAFWNTLNPSQQGSLLQKAGRLSDEFDNRIYPIETSFWGSESNPGIDNDPRVVVVLTNLIDTAGGFYDTSNQYPKNRVPESNEKDMIFLNVRALSNSSERKTNSFLAHEFQHLISFNQKTILRNSDDDIWLNETRSEYSPSLLGYNEPYEGSNLKRRIAAFLDNPTDSLTEWSNEAADYGQVEVFGEYLVEHFGSVVLSDSLHSVKSGIDSLSEALANNRFNFNFADVFLRWEVANAINDISFDTTLGYFNSGLRQEIKAPPTQTITYLNDDSDVIISHDFKDWQAKWFWISGFQPGQKNVLQASLSGAKKNFFKAAAIIFRQNGEKEVEFFDLSDPSANTNLFFKLSSQINPEQIDVDKIIFIPVKTEKTGNFNGLQELSTLNMDFRRIAEVQTTVSPSPTPLPILFAQTFAKPSDFGLKEGDFIRAEGDNDIYIVNDFGYKRLVLSPKICLQYGHLGARGCFSAVKIVPPSVRDAFKTSWYFSNGETNDGKVYFLEQTGEDEAVLHHLDISGNDFASQGGNFKSVFIFNTREQNAYLLGQDLKNLPK